MYKYIITLLFLLSTLLLFFSTFEMGEEIEHFRANLIFAPKKSIKITACLLQAVTKDDTMFSG